MDRTVGILGGGQLGRMMVQEATRMGIKVNILDKAGCPAVQINATGDHIDGSFTDEEKVLQLARTVDVLTCEIEHVQVDALAEVEKEKLCAVEPSASTLRLIQNKLHQHQHLREHNIAVAEFEEVKENSLAEIERIGNKFGYPMMLKSQLGAYDGRGNASVKDSSSIRNAVEALGNRPLYAEKWANFKMELAVMVVKCHDQILSYPTVETVQKDSICSLVFAPARGISDIIDKMAQALAKDAVATLNGRGCYAVEMFLLEDDEVVVNEIAPRVHNSYHFSIETCPVSQFEAHLRAILDLPISKQDLTFSSRHSIMYNLIGDEDPKGYRKTAAEALKIPGAKVHLYGKGDARPGRKMGHVTVVSDKGMAECEARLSVLVPELRSANGPAPLVGVIMGSGSDLSKLKSGLELLEKLGIPFEVQITSAHRTPELMREYAMGAAARGLCCIIAAAGGSAHLAGMTASQTILPVIAIPIKGSSLEMDSLLSNVQMPPGIPLATMGINNSINAALYAARILAVSDPQIRGKVTQYVSDLKAGVEKTRAKLSEMGWRNYEHTP